MSEPIATGHTARTNPNAPPTNHSFDGDCAVCGDPADGIDARDGQPKCEKHAKLRVDGGVIIDGDGEIVNDSDILIADDDGEILEDSDQ